MLPLLCPFCDAANPADAKFCNACGSPLHLKPCKKCGAVTEAAATRCGVCGSEFTRMRKNGEREHAAQAPAARGDPPLRDIHFEAEPVPELETETEGLHALLKAFEDAPPGTRRLEVDAPRSDLGTVRTDVATFPVARPARDIVTAPATSALRRPLRFAVFAAMALAALALVGYYLLRADVQPDVMHSQAETAAPPPTTRPSDAVADGAPVKQAAAPSQPSATAAVGSSAIALPEKVQTEAQTAPVGVTVKDGSEEATGPAEKAPQPALDSAEKPESARAEPVKQTLPSERVARVAPAQAAAASRTADRRPSETRTSVQVARQERRTPAAPPAGAAAPARYRSLQQPAAQRPPPCTEAVAALGLCTSIPRTGE